MKSLEGCVKEKVIPRPQGLGMTYVKIKVKGVEKMDLNELITWKNWGKKDEQINWPTLGFCLGCYGIAGGTIEEKDIDKETAFKIALIQHGYYIAKWEKQPVGNKEHFPYICSCECNHSWVVKARPRMCLTIYQCENCGLEKEIDSSD